MKCIKSGKTDSCIIQERCPRKRGNSAPPASARDIGCSAEQKKQDTQPCLKRTQACKRANSEATQPAVHQPKCQRSTQIRVQPIHDHLLDQIPEEDEEELAPVLSSAVLQSTAEFFDAISNHGPGVDSEVSDSGGEEVIDINVDDDNCNDSDPLSSESEDGNITQAVRSGQWQHRTAIKPAQRPGKSKKDTMSKGRVVAKLTSSNYDPETCAFDIQCAVCLPDGGNSPFKISSMVTLDELHITVSEKLHRFPGLISLCYRLDSDKAKFGATSIQSEEELDLFKTRMHTLIVPQCLPSGKLSTRPLKAVLVFFEDVSTADAKNPSTTTSNGNKAKPSSSPSSTLEGTTRLQKLVEDLQKHWRCEKHSKGPESLVYCYSPSGANICYPLTHANISYWAVEIMDDNGCGRVMVDRKPPGIIYKDVRPRSRSSNPPVPASHPSSLPYGSYPPPFFVLPPWGPPGFQGGNYTPSQPNEFPSHTSFNVPPANPSTSVANIPNIVDWFTFLDQHEQQNKDGITFSPYGTMLWCGQLFLQECKGERGKAVG
ncbi:hypothetical protein BKA83DRAFT_8627 [Pisolithus microcarpus]|nr:hypothetical protein BKA83DRAFT_8627 [Pisolithus microcarpus]